MLQNQLESVHANEGSYLLIDRAYEGDDTRNYVIEIGLNPVVPPKANRKKPWKYDANLYRKRNEIEHYFLRIKCFRRVFTRYGKLDIMFTGFILFAIIVDALISVIRF